MAARTIFEVPLSPQAQTFLITLAGVQYQFSVIWNSFSQCWILDIDLPDNTPVVTGIPLVPGLDLLSQFKHLNFGGSLVVQSDGNPDAVPTFSNLGLQGHLYFVLD